MTLYIRKYIEGWGNMQCLKTVVGIAVAINLASRFFSEQLSFYIHDTKCIRKAGALPPSCHDYNRVTSLDETATLAKVQPVLHTCVHVFHPIGQWSLCILAVIKRVLFSQHCCKNKSEGEKRRFFTIQSNIMTCMIWFDFLSNMWKTNI